MEIERNTGLITKEDLNFVKRLFVKNLLWIILIPIVFGIIGFLYAFKQTKEYGASSQILLNSSETYDYQEQINKNIGYYSLYSDITNQMRLIQSYDLVSEVLDSLDFDVSYFNEGKIRTTELYRSSPFRIVYEKSNSSEFRKVYEQKIYLKVIDEKSFILNSEIGLSGEYEFGEIIPLKGSYIIVNKSYDFSKERADAIKESTQYFVIHSKNYLINKYKSGITVENVEGTTILNASCKDRMQRKATIFLDSLTSIYQRNSIKNESEVKERTLFFIKQQLDSTRVKLNQSQSEIRNYKDSASILNLEKEEQMFFDRLVRYETDLKQEELNKSSLDSLKSYVLRLEDNNMLAPSYYMLVNDLYLKKLLNSLYDKQLSRRTMLLGITEKSAKIKHLDEEINAIKSNILIIVQNNLKASKEAIVRIKNKINEFEHKLAHIPYKSGGMLEIQREKQVNEKLYNFLLEKKASTEIAQVGIVSKVDIIEESRSMGLISKPINTWVIYFVLAGFLVALIIAFIRTLLFVKFQNLAELKDSAKTNVLAGIPYSKKNESSSLALEFGPKSNIAESFRGLRTNLEFLAAEEHPKIVLFTSVHPGEGKTYCSSNVATFLAATGKKVAMIDFDLHKPRLHERFNLKNTTGLSSILTGKKTFEEVVAKHEGFETLDLVLAGAIPPNPSELILGGKVEELLEKLKLEYDYIIFDTPPVGLITDALALMKLSHVNIFVMSAKLANKKGLEFIEEIISKSDSSNGIVLNQIVQKRWSSYYKNYGYSYGYGQGYGYGSSDYTSD